MRVDPERRRAERRQELGLSLRVLGCCLLGCGLWACQTTGPERDASKEADAPAVLELREPDAKTGGKKNPAGVRGYILKSPSERSGDWNKGVPVSKSNSESAPEG